MSINEDNFTEYVAYNQYGGIDRRIDREFLEKLVERHVVTGLPVFGVWQIRRDVDVHDIVYFKVRVWPDYDIGKKVIEDEWHSWLFTFVPYIP